MLYKILLRIYNLYISSLWPLPGSGHRKKANLRKGDRGEYVLQKLWKIH